MTSSLCLSITTFLYFLVSLSYLTALVFKSQAVGRLSSYLAWFTTAFQTGAIILRWLESYRLGIGHAPFTNTYESLIFFAWSIVLAYLILEWRYPKRGLGAAVTPFAFLAMAYASFGSRSEIQPLIPALQSNWLIAHVITCFLGYASFAVACGGALIYLGLGRRPRRTEILPKIELLDELIYRMVLIGFLLLTAGIATGAIWADKAWGVYWSWDPKETWSLITWLLYAAILHARLVRGWRGRRIAWLSVLGFASVLFTYFGVNFLLSGLHSYA